MSAILFEAVPFEEAAKIVKERTPMVREAFDKLLPELRARAFLISGVEDMSVVQRIRDLIAEVPRGTGWETAKKQIAEDLGPWMDEESAGKRATLLLRHHGFQAYSAAQHEMMQESKELLPYWKYLSLDDGKVRDSHLALHGLILPADDPFWQDHYPPWDWGCRCRVIPVSADEYEQAVADGRVAGKMNPTEATKTKGWTVGEAGLKALHDSGALDDGSGKPVNVDSPARRALKAEGPKAAKAAYQWNPADLRIPVEQLKGRYDQATWDAFVAAAGKTDIGDGRTLWQWLEGIDAGLAAAKKVAAAEAAQAALLADTSMAGAKAFGDTLTRLDEPVGGSTGAFVMQDANGQKYIVKTYSGRKDQVQNEYIANRLYAAAGIDVPEMRLVEVEGQLGVASKMLDNPNAVGLGGLEAAGQVAAVRKGFAADAWLGNWDVAGMQGDNLLRVGSKYYRVDQGGALLFRAQGGLKGAAFGKEVGELLSLRNAGVNPASARLFGGLTDAEIARQIRALRRSVKVATIEEIVTKSGLGGAQAATLKKTLQQRLTYLGKWEKSLKAPVATKGSVGTIFPTTVELKKNLDQYWNKLEYMEQKKVVEYTTTSGARRMNHLAHTKGIGDPYLDSALAGKLPKYKGMTARGMRVSTSEDIWTDDFKKFISGEWSYCEKTAYTSTSIPGGKKFDGNLKEFFINKGFSNGGYIGKKIAHDVEDEYLLGRKWKGRIVGWGESPDRSQRFLVYEEIAPGEKVPESQKPPKKMNYDDVEKQWRSQK